MDPILYKKLDWETTHGLDLLHHEAFQVGGAGTATPVKGGRGCWSVEMCCEYATAVQVFLWL